MGGPDDDSDLLGRAVEFEFGTRARGARCFTLDGGRTWLVRAWSRGRNAMVECPVAGDHHVGRFHWPTREAAVAECRRRSSDESPLPVTGVRRQVAERFVEAAADALAGLAPGAVEDEPLPDTCLDDVGSEPPPEPIFLGVLDGRVTPELREWAGQFGWGDEQLLHYAEHGDWRAASELGESAARMVGLEEEEEDGPEADAG